MIAAVAICALLGVIATCAWVVSVVFRDSRTRERAWEKKETTWMQERQQLLDRVMYMADKPWQMPELDQDQREDYEPPWQDPLQDPLPLDDLMFDINPAGSV